VKVGSAGLTLAEAGGGLFVHGYSQKYVTDIHPDAGRLGNIVQHHDYANAVWWQANTTTGYKTLTGTDGSAEYACYEVLPSKGPSAPTVTVPVALSYVDAATAIALAWVHNSNSGAAQERFTAKLTKVSDSSVVYLKLDGTVQSAAIDVTSAVQSASVTAGQLTAGQAYDLTVRTFDTGLWSVYSSAVRFTPLARPTVTSVTVTSPAEDLSPTVAWTMTAGLGAQTGWQVALVPSAHADPSTPTWVSAVTSGAATSTAAPSITEWANGATLYAWVRVADAVQWSAWTKDDATCKVQWTPPDAPSSVAVTDGSPMAVAVAGVAVGADTLQVEWSDDAKATWNTLATITGPGASVSVALPIAGYGAAIWARARTTDTVDGVSMPSAWRESAAAVTCTDTAAYLVADDTTDYLPVEVVADETRVLAQGVAVTYGLGATVAMVDLGPTMGEAGRTTLRTWTRADRAAVVAWLTVHATWRMRWNPERSEAGTVDTPATRMALASGIGWARLEQIDITPRDVTFAWVEQ
jgi:hypothetical protein